MAAIGLLYTLVAAADAWAAPFALLPAAPESLPHNHNGYWLLILAIGLIALFLFTRIRHQIHNNLHLQHTLTHSEERFRRLSHNARDVFYRISLPEQRCEYISPAARRLFGYTPNEFLRRPDLLAAIVHPDSLEYVQTTWQKILQGQHVGQFEYQVVHRSGRPRWINRRDILVYDAAGNAMAVEGIISDVTKQKSTEEALRESEKRYRGLINSSPDWVWEVDASGVYTYASPRVSDILGYSVAEVLGKTPFDFMPPQEAERVAEQFGVYVAAQRPFNNLQNSNRHKDGHLVVLETSGVPIFNDRGELLGYRGIDRDITERVHNEQQLQQEHEFTSAILEAASNVIIVIDLQGRFVRFNRAAEWLSGYRAIEVIGKPIWEVVIPPEQRSEIRQVFHDLRENGNGIAARHESEWLCRDGSRHLMMWHNSILHDEHGTLSHIVALGYDISEQREAEHERARLQRELQQAHKMESLGRLTGGIAHDFNNLLAVISGYGELISELGSVRNDEKLRGYMEHVKGASDRATRLVTQMLDFSRSRPTEVVRVALEPLLVDDINLIRATLPSTIEIRTTTQAELPDVCINPTQLNQILLNLAVNARDAMDGVGKLTIRLGWARDLDLESSVTHKPIKGDWVELAVSDTGSGIDKEIAENIFTPFFTTKEVGKGTGMGLSLIYGIMEQIGGHILIDTELGVGTTFRLLLPPVAGDAHSPATDEVAPPLPAHGGDNEILVVDDEVSISAMVKELLSNQGYRVTALSDSVEALEQFRSEPQRYAMVVTDQTMPQLTGSELVSRLRSLRPGLPAIICTGYSDTFNEEVAEQMGVHYLKKPLNSTALLQSVAIALAANRPPSATAKAV